VKAILRNANIYGVAVTLAKLLAAVCDEQEIDPVHFRRWSADAARRP
jgi:predicted benzoate:H+ symporter BenE